MTRRYHIEAGYVMDGSLPKMTKDAASQLTHLNVAFGHVVDDEVRLDHLQHLDRLPTIRSYNPALTVILSVGGWGAGGFSEAASTPQGRSKMAESAVRIVREHPIDGIDLDWEYPCHSLADIASSPEDKTNFTRLVKEMREALDRAGAADGRYYLLTIAAGADQYYLDGTEMGEVQKYLDFVQLMTYDMRGGFQTTTGHHTNLYTPSGDLSRISADVSVRIFHQAGVPLEKIVIGAAFYSRMWSNVPDRNHGLQQSASGVGSYGPSFDELAADYIDKNGYVRYWDDEAKAPYLFNGSNFITYDDEESLRHKCEYVKKEGLAGIMFWEYGHDTHGRLLDAISKSLR